MCVSASNVQRSIGQLLTAFLLFFVTAGSGYEIRSRERQGKVSVCLHRPFPLMLVLMLSACVSSAQGYMAWWADFVVLCVLHTGS
jgi:hypothetical protein